MNLNMRSTTDHYTVVRESLSILDFKNASLVPVNSNGEKYKIALLYTKQLLGKEVLETIGRYTSMCLRVEQTWIE